MRRLLLLPATLLVLTGCGAGDGTAGDPPSPPAQVATTAPAAAPTDAAEATAGPTETAAGVAVVLEPGGLGLSDGIGSTRRLPFDQVDQAAVAAALEAALGPPTGRETGLECGPGPLDALSWEGFEALFLDDAFAGWFLSDPAPAAMTTANGIGLGATRGELEAAFAGVTVDRTTIGIEWTAGELAGTLTGKGARATVDNLWSGATCIAR